MPISQNDYCWITYDAIDIEPGMWVSRILSKTPRRVTTVHKKNYGKKITLIADRTWAYLKDVEPDCKVDVLCNSITKKPILDEVIS